MRVSDKSDWCRRDQRAAAHNPRNHGDELSEL
jgi:hypothetical protein